MTLERLMLTITDFGRFSGHGPNRFPKEILDRIEERIVVGVRALSAALEPRHELKQCAQLFDHRQPS